MAHRNEEHAEGIEQQGASNRVAEQEKKDAACELGGCCAMIAGRGGKLRLALLIALAVVVVVLLVHGFATA